MIDAKEKLTRMEGIKPVQTPAIGPKSTEVTTRRSSSALGFSSSSVGSPSIKAMFSGESSSYLVMTKYGSRITQGDKDGLVWWGFNVDDPNEREAGKELNTLPTVEFEFYKENASLPAQLHVEVASVWTLIPSNKNKLQELIRMAKPKGLSYSNLCQVVQLQIPSTLLEDCHYKSLTDMLPSGNDRPPQVEHEAPHLVIAPSVGSVDRPVLSGSEPIEYIR